MDTNYGFVDALRDVTSALEQTFSPETYFKKQQLAQQAAQQQFQDQLAAYQMYQSPEAQNAQLQLQANKDFMERQQTPTQGQTQVPTQGQTQVPTQPSAQLSDQNIPPDLQQQSKVLSGLADQIQSLDKYANSPMAIKQKDALLQDFNVKSKLYTEGLQTYRQQQTEKNQAANQDRADKRLEQYLKNQNIGVDQTLITTPEGRQEIAKRYGYTKEGFQSLVDNYAVNQSLPQNMRSIKMAPLMSAIVSEFSSQYPGANAAINKQEFIGMKNAYSQTVSREAAVNRTIGAVRTLKPQILDLSEKISTRLGGQVGNMTMNELSRKFGDDPDIAKLRNLVYAASREYVIATTMPGSNAQMHTTHAEDAEKVLNMNMPFKQLVGAFEGIDQDMNASEKALTDEQDRLHERMRGMLKGQGEKESPATPASHVMSLDDYLKSKGH